LISFGDEKIYLKIDNMMSQINKNEVEIKKKKQEIIICQI
jgi:hypothetical protein